MSSVSNFDVQISYSLFKMKIILLAFVFLTSQLHAQLKLDTLTSSVVSKGVTYTSISVASIPWSIHVLEIDLSNPHIKIESVKANNLKSGNERMSELAKQNTYKNHIVVAAVNGDFYHKGGIPTNLQIRNGQIITMPIPRTVIAFDNNNKPMMNAVSYSGKIFTDNYTYSISGVNIPRADNLVLYNKYYGESTSTNSGGREVLIQRINPWRVNDTVKCVVKKIQIGIGNMEIPDTTFAVLSGERSSIEFTKHIRVGDTVKIVNSITPAIPRVNEAIGGFIQTVKEGKDFVDKSYVTENKPGHALIRHPRTAVGFSQDSTKLFLVAVDGRQKHSAGMTLHELAEVMIKLGVYHGLNLDGGGSTTMVVKDIVVNIPSDGKERAVSNGLLIILNEPVLKTQ